MTRERGTDRNGSKFAENIVAAVWAKGTPIHGGDPSERKDACGSVITRDDYGKTSNTGWEIDHIVPVTKQGGDELENLQPLHWKTNEAKGDGVTTPCPCTGALKPGIGVPGTIGLLAIAAGCVVLAMAQSFQKGDDVALLMIAALMAAIMPYLVGTVRELMLTRPFRLKYRDAEVEFERKQDAARREENIIEHVDDQLERLRLESEKHTASLKSEAEKQINALRQQAEQRTTELRKQLGEQVKSLQAQAETYQLELEQLRKKLSNDATQEFQEFAAQLNNLADRIAAPTSEKSKSKQSDDRGKSEDCLPKAEYDRLFRGMYGGKLDQDDPLKSVARTDRQALTEYGIAWIVNAVGRSWFEITITTKPKDSSLEGSTAFVLLHPSCRPRWWSERVEGGTAQFKGIQVWGGFTCRIYFCKIGKWVEFDLTEDEFRKWFKGTDKQWETFQDN